MAILSVMWQHGQEIHVLLFHSPLPFNAEAGEKASPDGIRLGELPLTAMSYNTVESRPCIMCEQHSRVNLKGEGMGKPASKL